MTSATGATESQGRWVFRHWNVVMGPLAFAAILLLPSPEGLGVAGHRVLAVTAWTAIWWVTEALPINATALLPFALFPFVGVMGAPEAAKASMSDSMYLFLGGFFLAAALERWGLHRRLALGTLRLMGTSARRLLFGVMVIVAFLSFWLTNTATTVMMIPILLAVIDRTRGTCEESVRRRFAAALILGTALAANIGGMGTPVGTVPNAVLVGQLAERGIRISFVEWMVRAVPVVVVLVPLAWAVLVFLSARIPRGLVIGDPSAILTESRGLGPWSAAERRVGFVFISAAVLWLTRQDVVLGENLRLPGWAPGLARLGLLPAEAADGIRDGTVAVLAALALFAIPAGKGDDRLLDWEHASRVPWGVLFLLGGGLVLARGFEIESDDGASLGSWVGSHLIGMRDLPLIVQLIGIAILVSLLTEFASNTATCTLMLPILLGLAAETGDDPLPYGMAVALGASCSFMMPVATPPNALAFGTGLVPMGLMIRNGLYLNVLGALAVGVMVWLVCT